MSTVTVNSSNNEKKRAVVKLLQNAVIREQKILKPV